MRNTEKKAPARKKAKPATKERLRAGALFYLERYATSAENLRQVLLRRVYKSSKLHDTDANEGAEYVDDIITNFIDLGLLNDATYARMKVDGLMRRGTSIKAIRQKLLLKGINQDIINKALEEFEDETGNREINAAFAYIKRRRLGPYRTKAREESQEKDMAALGRQGFPFDLARKLILAENVESLIELVEDEL